MGWSTKDSKDWEFIKLEDDGIVCDDPCFVKSLQIKSGAAIGTATLHNGHSAASEEVMCMTSAINRCARNKYDIPLYFSKGIFAVLDANCDWVRVRIMRERRKT